MPLWLLMIELLLLDLRNNFNLQHLKHRAGISAIHYKLGPVKVEPQQNQVSGLRGNKNSTYKVAQGEIVFDLVVECGKELIQQYPELRNEIDFLIYCTESPDYVSPAASCLLQHALSLKNQMGTMDLAFGCSGFTHGISFAKSLIDSGIAKCVLFITGDMPSKVIHPEDVYIYTLFSDSASCTVVTESTNYIGQSVFGTDGSGEEHLRVVSSAIRNPRDIAWMKRYESVGGLPYGRMEMNGEAIFRFSIEKVPVLVNEILQKNQLIFDEIDFFVFHQASEIILKSLKRKLQIPDEKFLMNVNEIGNTVSASIPILLKQSEEKGIIKKGMKVLLAGFGVGFSWSGTVIYY